MLANLDDVKDRLPEHTTIDEREVHGLIHEATILVESHLRKTFHEDEIPQAVRVVVSRMVARVLQAPKSTQFQESMQVSAGPFSHSGKFVGGGSGGAPWLSAQDKTMLAPFRARRRRGGVYSVDLT